MTYSHFKFLFITANPRLASFAIEQGVDQIFLDLEIMGKIERQGHLDTVISKHNMEDISKLRPNVPLGSLLVRLNPIHAGSAAEIDSAVLRGADTLMLPMFRSTSEVKYFCEAVDSRAKVCLLVETVDAMEDLAKFIEIPGVNEVHIGLNDLHIELGARFMFQPFVSGHVEQMAEILRSADVPFGIGGLARVGEGLLPADLLLADHVRFGSTAAILSRTFHRNAGTVEEIQLQMNFGEELKRLRKAYKDHLCSQSYELDLQHEKIRNIVEQIIKRKF